eukprot:2334576-Rhodomonas_salina.1
MAYGAARCAVLSWRMLPRYRDTERASGGACRLAMEAQLFGTPAASVWRCAIGLRACYAMPGTEIAYGREGKRRGSREEGRRQEKEERREKREGRREEEEGEEEDNGAG